MKSKKNVNNSGKILIQVRSNQTRVAQMEADSILSYHVYKSSDPYLVGSIYNGRVTKVLPGMGVCFVDIGWDREVFLHMKEIFSEKKKEERQQEKDKTAILKQLTEGQIILVQIIKNPIGSKSAQVSMWISLVGSKLIYMPQLEEGVGISKKILDEKERKRLQEAVEKLNPKGKLIIRTKAKGESRFKNELKHLYKTWDQIKNNKRKSKGLVFEDIPVELQILRDGLSSDKIQVWIDDNEIYKKAIKFIKEFLPEFKKQINFYKEKRNLFEKFNLEKKIKKALKRKVYLKSGGAIVIDENEAMVTIDVNTARSIGKTSQEKTIVNTNLEAVKEIASQIRIRNLGGIIVIDLIDMDLDSSKEKVLSLLQDELKKDSVYTEIVSVSSLNLVQMTRKRTRPSLQGLTCEKCPVCSGDGYLKSPSTIADEIFNEVIIYLKDDLEEKEKASLRKIEVICHPLIADWMQDREGNYLEFLAQKYHAQLLFKTENDRHREEFEVNL